MDSFAECRCVHEADQGSETLESSSQPSRLLKSSLRARPNGPRSIHFTEIMTSTLAISHTCGVPRPERAIEDRNRPDEGYVLLAALEAVRV
jgi:hypothetical protein